METILSLVEVRMQFLDTVFLLVNKFTVPVEKNEFCTLFWHKDARKYPSKYLLVESQQWKN